MLALYSLKQQTRLLNMITQWQRTENITRDNFEMRKKCTCMLGCKIHVVPINHLEKTNWS